MVKSWLIRLYWLEVNVVTSEYFNLFFTSFIPYSHNSNFIKSTRKRRYAVLSVLRMPQRTRFQWECLFISASSLVSWLESSFSLLFMMNSNDSCWLLPSSYPRTIHIRKPMGLWKQLWKLQVLNIFWHHL